MMRAPPAPETPRRHVARGSWSAWPLSRRLTAWTRCSQRWVRPARCDGPTSRRRRMERCASVWCPVAVWSLSGWRSTRPRPASTADRSLRRCGKDPEALGRPRRPPMSHLPTPLAQVEAPVEVTHSHERRFGRETSSRAIAPSQGSEANVVSLLVATFCFRAAPRGLFKVVILARYSHGRHAAGLAPKGHGPLLPHGAHIRSWQRGAAVAEGAKDLRGVHPHSGKVR